MLTLLKIAKYLPILYKLIKWLIPLLPNKSKYQKKIEAVMKKAGEIIPDSPTDPDEEIKRKRIAAVLKIVNSLVQSINQGDSLADIAQKCVDLNKETVKILSSYGLPDKPLKQVAIQAPTTQQEIAKDDEVVKILS